MLNTLANHGFMPRDGKDINKKLAIDVLSEALNWDVVDGATWGRTSRASRVSSASGSASASRSPDTWSLST